MTDRARVHHLNCGTMKTVTGRIVCHVLLVEAGDGLVLIDTGFGLEDIATPAVRLGPIRHLLGAVLDPEETASRQVEKLGFSRSDVRDVVVTHFDLDHIGGLADFPHARVHTTAAEVLGAVVQPDWRERRRFRPAQWAHQPKLVEHTPDGEAWMGFAAAKEILPGVILVSLPGHTRGHACVAVADGQRWLLHAGDAFYHPASIGGPGRTPRFLGLMEKMIAYDRRQVHDNHGRLAELYRRNDVALKVLCAHDASTFDMATTAGT